MTSYSLIKTAKDGSRIIKDCLNGVEGARELLQIVSAKLEMEATAAGKKHMADTTVNPSLQSEADGLHAAIGALFIWGPILLFHCQWDLPLIACVTFAMLKEFVWDIRFESPNVSGEWLGGLRDFAGYVVGAGVAIGLFELSLKFVR